MVESELNVRYALEKIGWTVHRSGWPDFLCIREKYGEPEEIIAVEVKSGNDSLKPEQKIIHHILKRAGINVQVIRPEDLTPAMRLKRSKILISGFDRDMLIEKLESIKNMIGFRLGDLKNAIGDVKRLEDGLLDMRVFTEDSCVSEGLDSEMREQFKIHQENKDHCRRMNEERSQT